MPISGRYESSAPAAPGAQLLHLRVDVDETVPHAPITHHISGDLFTPTGVDPDRGSHVFSWSVNVLASVPRALPFTFEGTATILGPGGGPAAVRVDIVNVGPTLGQSHLQATVSLTRPGDDEPRVFVCVRKGVGFRTLDVDLDVCRTAAFRKPEYHVGSHPPLPKGVGERDLDIVTALGEAGVTATLKEQKIIDDISKENRTWDDSELDAAMAAQLQSAGLDDASKWPRWFIWAFLATRHDSEGHLGIMFDSEHWPFRQGCAVFRDHREFGTKLPGSAPKTEDEAAVLRFYFFTWLHEIGHCFRIRHSGDQGRPDALSWMNHLDAMHDRKDFWSRFGFSFDAKELLHIRHGNWLDVVMGGERLGAPGHLSSDVLDHLFCPPAPLTDSPKPPQLELLLRSRGYFDFMGPVKVEARLRNLDRDCQSIKADLQPEAGHFLVLIRRPDGRLLEYRPLIRAFRDVPVRSLEPCSRDGRDRYSEEIDLTFGRRGFYFSDPGEYHVRATYVIEGGAFVVSDWLRLRVGYPWSKDFDRLAQDFFAPEVGRCLYLQGSQAPYLSKAFDILQNVTGRCRGTVMGADLALSLMAGVGRSFSEVEDRCVKEIKKADPHAAVALTNAALQVFESREEKALNLRHARLVHARSRCRVSLEEREPAVRELIALHDRLRTRGVHDSVLEEVRTTATNVAAGKVPTPWASAQGKSTIAI